ncbi:MAG: hypothetical protein J1F04_00795 [Oscillospiraceae bacterium]|nr:hypothetical protein [Oscillospiraceae bacterium]
MSNKPVINREDAYRYMGIREPFSENVDEKTAETADKCEAELLSVIKPRFTWRVFNIIRNKDGIFPEGCDFALEGKSIEKHLDGCEKLAIVCSTLSADCDKFISKMSVCGALEMLVSDALASAYIEQISEDALSDLLEKNAGYSSTWIFGAGYGDFPLEVLPKLISAADAARKVGISTTASNTLIPSKSIVGIAGLSKKPFVAHEKSCESCNLRETCEFRRRGDICELHTKKSTD